MTTAEVGRLSLVDPNTYMSQCQRLLERMFNTVPHGVSLTEEITLILAKVWGVQLTIEKGQLVFKANLRVYHIHCYMDHAFINLLTAHTTH